MKITMLKVTPFGINTGAWNLLISFVSRSLEIDLNAVILAFLPSVCADDLGTLQILPRTINKFGFRSGEHGSHTSLKIMQSSKVFSKNYIDLRCAGRGTVLLKP